MLVKKDINVGDSVVMPVHLHEHVRARVGTVVEIAKHFFVVEFVGAYVDENGVQARFRESYSWYGEEERPSEVICEVVKAI